MRRCSDQLPTPSDGSPQGRDGELQTPRNSSIMQRERERERERKRKRERERHRDRVPMSKVFGTSRSTHRFCCFGLVLVKMLAVLAGKATFFCIAGFGQVE